MPENNQNEHQEFVQEYTQVKKDVKRVVVTNLLLILALVAIYLANQKFGFLARLESWF